jgi:hypothetical protein
MSDNFKALASEILKENNKAFLDLAETKLKEERMLSNMVIERGLNLVICRLGTIFGVSPGMRFHTAVNKFCWQAAMGQSITVWKTAYEQKRPYLDLGDATKAIAFLIKKDVFDGRVYNVVTTNVTVKEVVETIQEFVPSLEISFVDSKIMNQLSYEVLSNRFQSLGFQYSGNLRSAVFETVEVLKNASHLKISFLVLSFYLALVQYSWCWRWLMGNIPLVSIAMSVYNPDHTLRAAVISVLKQDLKSWELLIVDDFTVEFMFAFKPLLLFF